MSMKLIASKTLVLALALAFALPASADEPTASAARQRLERALSAIEFIPTREVLVGIHPEVPRMLHEIVRGKTLNPLARTRAITVLRHFPGKKTVALLEGLIVQPCKAKDGLCRLDLQQALASYASVKGHAAVGKVAPFLAHANMDLRMAAALALRLSGSPRALPLMAEQLTREKSATVRAEIEQQIRIMEHSEKKVPRPKVPGR